MAIDELAFAGYWFYESDQDQQDQASLFASYGLIEDAPTPAAGTRPHWVTDGHVHWGEE